MTIRPHRIPAACLAFASVCLAAAAARGTPWYEYKVIARAGQNGLTGMEPQSVSVNDTGVVSFIGQLNNSSTSFEDVFVGDGAAAPRNISMFSGATRNFANGTQITNGGLVIARDQVSGSPPQSLLRTWNSASTGSFTTIARGGAGQPFDSVLSHPSVNNSGQPVFSALITSDNLIHLCTPRAGTPPFNQNPRRRPRFGR